ncbi:uncharacterized protein LOC142036381 isoform X2 [Buteo buteo]|uniref:uncharacterized protein LOC142036381 isoform X2 n=1 Tax=Buteo buteo TaxID=30397 RepID=UPI003EBB67E2
MKPRGIRTGWLCIAVLCCGAALILKKEEPGHQSTTQRDDILEHVGEPTTSAEDVDKLTRWPTATPMPPWTADTITTSMPTRAGAMGNKTRTQDQATPASDSSDLGALDHLPIQDTTPIIPTSQEEKGPEKPPEHTETTFCEPDPPPPPPPQPDTPTVAGGPCCSGEPGAV